MNGLNIKNNNYQSAAIINPAIYLWSSLAYLAASFFLKLKKILFRIKERFGYFGNLTKNHLEALLALRAKLKEADQASQPQLREEICRSIPEFDEVLSEFKGLNIKFFVFSQDIPRAPPAGFIWAYRENEMLEIYFPFRGMVEVFKNTFKDNLPQVLEIIVDHEYQEIIENKDHGTVDKEIHQQYPQEITSVLDDILCSPLLVNAGQTGMLSNRVSIFW